MPLFYDLEKLPNSKANIDCSNRVGGCTLSCRGIDCAIQSFQSTPTTQRKSFIFLSKDERVGSFFDFITWKNAFLWRFFPFLQFSFPLFFIFSTQIILPKLNPFCFLFLFAIQSSQQKLFFPNKEQRAATEHSPPNFFKFITLKNAFFWRFPRFFLFFPSYFLSFFSR